MNEFYISKQKIINKRKETFAYELVFKDSENHLANLSTTLKGTSQLIINTIASTKIDALLDTRVMAFINVDEVNLTKGILDVLDTDRFILNILENIELNQEVISKIIHYKKKGFKFSIEHFDSSVKMIEKFKNLFNYIDIIKMDILLSNPRNLEKVLERFKGTRIQFLAQGVESKEDHIKYLEMGFDYFQGYYIDEPKVIEVQAHKEAAQFTILQLIRLIKENQSTEEIEKFIKKQPDLSFKLIQFLNSAKRVNVRVESLTQVITLMGRNKLLRWLMVYLYAEVSTNTTSKAILELAIKRAERMESEAEVANKDKAYLAGMFSMLSSIFDTDIKELMNAVKMDRDITNLVLDKKGIFAASLKKAEAAEKAYLKQVMLENFEKLNTTDLIYALEDGGIEIDKNKIL